MPHGISRETFEGYDVNSKLNTIFDLHCGLHDKLEKHAANQIISCKDRQDSCDKRIGKLENRKKFDSILSSLMGIVGGFFAVIGKWFFFKGA